MFKKDFSWIDDYIDINYNNGRVLTAQALEECKKLLEAQAEEIVNLKRELSRYKGRKKKVT